MRAALLALALAAHPDSISRTRIDVDGARARVEIAVQTVTLLEELGFELDSDGDLELAPDELAAARASIDACVLEGFSLRARGERLAGSVRAAEPVRGEAGGAYPKPGQWIVIQLAYDAERPIEDLEIGFRLFEATNPGHRDYATLHYRDEDPQTHVFGLGVRAWEHEPWAERRPRVVRAFAARGARAAATAWATLALFAALAAAAPRGRPALAAAALAAGAAAAGVVPGALELAPLPAAFGPLAAALSAAYVATDTLLRRAPRRPRLEAVAFGLVHGLAVGASLAPALAREPQTRAALAGLAAGAALALAALALALATLLGLAPGARAAGGDSPDARAWHVAAPWRQVACALAALAGFALFARLAGFLPSG